MIIVTGRPERYRVKTIDWLRRNDITNFRLYMRPNGDLRQDDQVKSDILNQIHLDGYKPFLVIDDRQSVVDMWRRQGLVCLQNTPMEEAPTAEEASKILVAECEESKPCCDRSNEYNGFASGPTIFTCPVRCMCHD